MATMPPPPKRYINEEKARLNLFSLINVAKVENNNTEIPRIIKSVNGSRLNMLRIIPARKVFIDCAVDDNNTF